LRVFPRTGILADFLFAYIIYLTGRFLVGQGAGGADFSQIFPIYHKSLWEAII
jgi:hypothetical protein